MNITRIATAALAAILLAGCTPTMPDTDELTLPEINLPEITVPDVQIPDVDDIIPDTTPTPEGLPGGIIIPGTPDVTGRHPAPYEASVLNRSATAAEVTAALDNVTVIPAEPTAPIPYDRDAQFGKWTDDHDGLGGHNGCDTRNDMLSAHMTQVTYKEGTRDCVVLYGLLADPFTGYYIPFQRGQGTSNDVQVDHLRALSSAWHYGAWQWTQQERINFANDQAANLWVVDGPTNGSKSDSGPAQWLPADRHAACVYTLAYAEVSAKYDLPVSENDMIAMRYTASYCG